MTELQMGLIGLGATAVVGVFAYNKWQEYRHRKLAEKVLDVRHADVLLDEPVRDGFVADSAAHDERPFEPNDVPSPSERDEPTFDEAPVAASERIEPVLRIDSEPEDEGIEPVDESRADAPQTRTAYASDALAEPESVASSFAETASEPVAQSAELHRELKNVPEPIHLLSPQVDYIAAFEAVEPAASYQLLDSQANVLSRIRKPVHWLGFNEASHEWM